MKVLHVIAASLCLAFPISAQDMSADEVRQAARDAFGVALPDIENYPDSMVAGAWAWMSDVEDGKGALDPLCCTNRVTDGSPLSLDRLIPRLQ